MLGALTVASFLSLAAAQIDPRARELLEGLVPATAEPLRTVDQTLTTVMYDGGAEVMRMTQRVVIDFENRRLAAMSDIEGMTTRMVLKDGRVTMSMAGMTLPAPPDLAAQLEQLFDQGEPVLLKETDTATYDGVVAYGDLVSGEQVTHTQFEDGEPATASYLFDAGGIKAIYADHGDEGEFLMVFDRPVGTQALLGFDATSYLRTGGAWVMSSRTTVESIEFNSALDESLFD